MIRRVILSSAELAFRPNHLSLAAINFAHLVHVSAREASSFLHRPAVGDFVRQGRKRAQERGVRFGPAAGS